MLAFTEMLKPTLFENEFFIVVVLPTDVVPVYYTKLLAPGGA